MDVTLNEEELTLRDAARACLGKSAPIDAIRRLGRDRTALSGLGWQSFRDLGVTGILVPEDPAAGFGGAAVRFAGIVSEEIGRSLFPGPFASTALVAYALAASELPGPCQRNAELLDGLTEGRLAGAWCLAEGEGAWLPDATAVSVREADGHYELTATKSVVADAHVADVLLVTARSQDGPVQFVIGKDQPGVTVSEMRSLDLSRTLCEVVFDRAPVPADALLAGDAAATVTAQFELACALQCAESMGAAQVVFEQALQYAKDRIAFGRPIGSFQAIKHLLADTCSWLEAGHAATWAALASVAARAADSAQSVTVATAFVSEYSPRIIENCMQVLGGIAMTWEHDFHLYLRRAVSNAALYGDAAWHKRRLYGMQVVS